MEYESPLIPQSKQSTIFVGVGVSVGVIVVVGVLLGVSVVVTVGVTVFVGVWVGVIVPVGVTVLVGVSVGVTVDVGVGVGVGHTMSPFRNILQSSQLSKTLYELKVNDVFGIALDITVQALNPSSVVNKNVF